MEARPANFSKERIVIPYIPIEVSDARDIAERREKDIVIILAFDHGHDRTHVTTFGRSADDKMRSGQIGEAIAEDYGGEPTDDLRADWRLIEQAELCEALNAAVKVIRTWHGMGHNPESEKVAWDLYYRNAPEMRLIRETLDKKHPAAAVQS
jgi:hypothetical protein